MKTKILLLIVGVIVLTGCTRENFLDFVPKGNIIPTKIEDYRLMLDQAEQNLNGIGNGFANSHFESLYVTDNMQFTQPIAVALGFQNNAIAAYTFRENLYLASEEDSEWSNYYNQIYTANVVLAGLDEVTNGTEQEKNQLKAEAKLHRAFAYFNLVNLYSVHYEPNSAATDLGVPIREGIELEGVDLTRASVQEVYDNIIADITSSTSDLESISANDVRFRPSEAGALGLLAKVYLYQGNYDQALTQIDQALAIYNTVRDMNTDVGDGGFGAIELPLASSDDEVVWFKGSRRPNTPAAILDTTLINTLYEENDLRGQSYAGIEILITNQEIEERVEYGFYGRTFNRTIPAGINVPDLLLMKAECEARLGNNLTAANDALNALREKRFATDTYVSVNITDQNALLDFVKEERRRELMGQPERMFDLKRYNRFDNAGISLVHEYDGIDYTLAPNSLNWALPIAQKYILLNPEIIQNPRD